MLERRLELAFECPNEESRGAKSGEKRWGGRGGRGGRGR